jgi:hypothetical protein
MMNRRFFSLLWALLFVLMASAQQGKQARHFSPEQFDAELQKFITQETGLTSQEAAKFFPVYKEMLLKQRSLYMRQRQFGRTKPADEEGCKKAVQERDAIELEQKHILQQYHNKFFELLPASKVYDILQAEDRFHRHKLRQWGGGGNRPGPKKNN